MNRTAQPQAIAEALESRRLMDATLVDGKLVVTGTETKDVVVITLDKDDATQLLVNVNRDRQAFALDAVREIEINLLGGGDKLTVSETAGVIYPDVKADGGAGNDVIATGSGNDLLLGGDGNDRLAGGDGDDYLFGDAGNDRLVGGGANDYVDGGDGNDTLAGGLDDDTLLAGDGKDRVDAGAGDDNVDGGAGRDAIKTGDGADAIAQDASGAPATGRGEVRDQAADDSSYALAELTADVAALHEMVVPGSTVFRAELADGFMTLYYRFGQDPTAYKTVLFVGDAIEQGNLMENVELVSREVSVSELRPSAVALFDSRTPNLGIVSFRSVGSEYEGEQGTGGEEIRYRDLDGAIQLTTTHDIAWTLDEAEEDLDNDGRFDQSSNNGEPLGVPLDPSWTPIPSGDGRTLYQDAEGKMYEPREDGLYYPHFQGNDGQ